MPRRPRTRRRERKSVPIGRAYVQSTFNNTMVTLTDREGNVIAWGSAGTVGFSGSRKSTAFAAQRAGEDAARKGREHGLRAVADSTRRGDARTWDSLAASVDSGVASEVAALMNIVEVPRPPGRRSVGSDGA